MLKAFDADGAPDDIVRRDLERRGPPYLFGAAVPLKVGDAFMLGGQPFVVVRISDREEFMAYQSARGVAPRTDRSVCYVEAVTD